MPEPVVIYGPAAGPAGPIPEQPDPAQSDSPAEDRAEGGETIIPPRRGLRIVRTILEILGRVCWAVARAILRVMRQNPRHSIAAVASLLILGGILYSQTRSGTARRDVTNLIRSTQAPTDDESKGPDAPKPDPALAAAPKSEASDPEKKPIADAASPPKPAEPSTVTAQTDAAGRLNLPAPKPGTNHDPVVAAGPLAKADTPEKRLDHPEPAPAPGPAGPDLVATPLPPPGGELAKATLLEPAATKTPVGAAPAPVSSLPKDEKNGIAAEIGAASQTPTRAPDPSPSATASPAVAGQTKSDVPEGLFLPEGAPKDSVKESGPPQAAETVVAPAQSGPGQPPEDPNKVDGPDAKPTGPALPSPADSITGLVPVPVVAAPVVQSPTEPKPAPAAVDIPPVGKGQIEAPAAAPKVLDRVAEGAGPDRSTRGPAEVPHESGMPALAPSVSAAAIASERAASTGGEKKPVLPAGEGAKTGSAEQNASSSEPKIAASSPKDHNEPGWISIPNSGMVPRDPTDDPARGGSEADPDAGSVPAARGGDSRAHAARAVAFEPEPSQSPNREPGVSDSTGLSRRSGAGSTKEPQPRTASHSERVEATDHLVERDENYWTISRQYYNSGRYYRALWKANSAKYPDINVLHVNDVIVVPAVEDLDSEYILPARTRAPSRSRAASSDPAGRGQGSRRDDETDATVTGSTSRSSGSLASGRVSLAARSSEAGSRGADAADSDLDPPVSGASDRRDRLASNKGRSPAASSIFDGNADEPETRESARPRSPGGATPGRPVYRVRSYDTLRSIARDTLGDSRRSDEILELNRGLIDDPAQLVVGQLLELPEDARTAIRRPASRR